MADRVAHLPHLAVAAFADRHDERGLLGVAAVGLQPDIGGLGSAPVDDETSRKAREIALVRDAEDARFIDARDTVARVREPRRQVAVVGEQQ
jgi:hypothetical protein